jgi:hypothetical protein
MTHPDEARRRGSGFHQSWQALGFRPCEALVEPRIVLHHALQAVTEAARHLAPSDEPAGESEWLESHHALASPVLHGLRGGRVALRPAELTLLLLDVDGAAIKTRPLERSTVDDAFAWLRSELEGLGVDASQLVVPASDVPPLPEHLGGVLACSDREAFAELERWLVNADHVLRAIARVTQDARPVRCPGDRLELSTEITHPTREGEGDRGVGVGLSLGDGQRPAPHFFVTAVPATEAPEGWEPHDGVLRAVLPGPEILRHREAEAQATAVDAFLQSALAEAHHLVQRQWRRR